MQQCADGGGGAEADFLYADAGHLDGVEDIGFARFPPLLGVGFCGQFEGMPE